MNKTIFLTNDDGYFSQSLIELRNELSKIARVVVMAPAHEKSACGHGLCVNKPMQIIKIEEDFYKLDDGGPTDCVYIGMCELFQKNKPDLIISGINIGANLGEDVTYSGTVAGAMEGSLQGINSIAISQAINDKYGEDDKTAKRDFALAIDITKQLALDILNNKFEIGYRKLLNINVPSIQKNECKGVKITQLGHRIFSPTAQKTQSPRNKEYHWIGLNPIRWEARDNSKNPYIKGMNYNHNDMDSEIRVITDFDAIANNYISITPIHLDMTNYADIPSFYSYCKNNGIL